MYKKYCLISPTGITIAKQQLVITYRRPCGTLFGDRINLPAMQPWPYGPINVKYICLFCPSLLNPKISTGKRYRLSLVH